MYVNHKNKTNNVIDVTSNDANFYYNEKKIISPYKVPFQIVKLQPGQELIMTAVTKLGTEMDNVFHSAVGCVFYKQIDDNTFEFTLESRGQITERRILLVALLNIEKRIKHFYELFEKEFVVDESDPLLGVIIMNDEDHTLGNLISRGLQKHKQISYAGYKLEHPLVRKVYWEYKLAGKHDIKKIVKDVVDYYLEIVENMKKQFQKI
jgi:DNA-directed RNA polymerase subunit L